MRVALVGSVESSAVALRSLLAADIKPVLIVTLPTGAARRHSDFVELSQVADGLPVRHTTNINEAETLAALKSVAPDLCLVIGWSQICGEAFRRIAKFGTVGFHPSPLPRLRGRAVIPWTILEGEKSSASTLFWLDDGLDSGDILLQWHFEVSPAETARSLYEKHTVNIARMVPEAVKLVRSGSPPRLAQNHMKATYCAKRTRDDGLIDWHQPAEEIARLIRAVGDPYPGAFTYLNGHSIMIDAASPHQLSGRFIGLAGQVQAVEIGHFVVRCGDGECIVVTQWRSPSGVVPRLHGKFQNFNVPNLTPPPP